MVEQQNPFLLSFGYIIPAALVTLAHCAIAELLRELARCSDH
jgi:hypothetical protein